MMYVQFTASEHCDMICLTESLIPEPGIIICICTQNKINFCTCNTVACTT